MKTAELRTGRTIPLNGFGTWKSERGEVGAALRAALDAGYRHIDCAAVYMNEKEVGEVLNEYLGGPEPKLQRSDLFITSKVWNTCHGGKVRAALDQTLSDLQITYVDLYLVHHPFSWEFAGLPITEDNWVKRTEDGKVLGGGASLQETWKAMEGCVDAGLAVDIGVSNYSVALLADAMQYARIKPAVNQCEAHVCNTRAELRQMCDEYDVHFTCYSVLGSGKDGPLGDIVVREIADKLAATPAQVLIAWGIAKGCSVLAKSVKEERIKANFEAGKLELEEADVEKLDALDRELRTCNMVEYWGFPSHA